MLRIRSENRPPELTYRLLLTGIRNLSVRSDIPDLTEPFTTTRADVERVVTKYLLAVQEAGKIYRHISAAKGEDTIIAEVSMDETDLPQTPPELLIILAMLADEKVRLQTIAPKFTGRFNKGVDYVGDLRQFEREFNDDLAVIAHAVRQYGLPSNLKLSVHSGSDKFSLYPIIRKALAKNGSRPAHQDGRNDMAGRTDRTRGSRWRRSDTRERDLRLRTGARR